MTKPKRYKRFSSEFKREAIMRASEEGMTDKAQLGARSGAHAFLGAGREVKSGATILIKKITKK